MKVLDDDDDDDDVIFKKNNKIQNFFRSPLNFFRIFSLVFLSILDNIRLYIYTVRYRFTIKIPSFLQNISKKI
jgi:hypothetical protein